MTLYFTSDTHFGHKNILKYSKRPFSSIEEHDESLIVQWNAVVRPEDTIYHLGDFGLAHKDYLKRILRRLNGNKHFIRGNHDKTIDTQKDLRDMFVSYQDYKEIYGPEKQKIILFHYPIASWNKRHFGSWDIHGHCHNTFPSDEFHARVDVGVDAWNYTPVSFEQLKKHMSAKKFKPVDHHVARL
jgi:calcineurin-like phosphoesterase family protein